jgi:hypothetical protein
MKRLDRNSASETSIVSSLGIVGSAEIRRVDLCGSHPHEETCELSQLFHGAAHLQEGLESWLKE